MMLQKLWVGLFLLLSNFATSQAQAEPLQLLIDADYTISTSAAQSIEIGLKTALAEEGFQLGGFPVEVVAMDHRANVKRSKRTFEYYLKNKRALAIIGGMHSPPYLQHRSFLNENSILTLLPWSAAGPITRASDGQDNWIFRLSVDDTQAGAFFVDQMEGTGACENVALILLDTGWGKANYKTLTTALTAISKQPGIATFFPSGISETSAANLAAEVASTWPDCAVLLANWNDGATVIKALHKEHPTLRIFSHWGIMGGDFANAVPHEMRSDMRIRVLQTCGLQREAESSAILSDALSQSELGVSSLAEVAAPTGFVHGYDLGRVLIAAAKQANSNPEAQQNWRSQDMEETRHALRTALQSLERPVDGILKRYAPPFAPYGPDAPDAHEALSQDDLCLAQFRQDGRLEHAN